VTDQVMRMPGPDLGAPALSSFAVPLNNANSYCRSEASQERKRTGVCRSFTSIIRTHAFAGFHEEGHDHEPGFQWKMNYDQLYRRLTNQLLISVPGLGGVKPMPAREPLSPLPNLERKQEFQMVWLVPFARNRFSPVAKKSWTFCGRRSRTERVRRSVASVKRKLPSNTTARPNLRSTAPVHDPTN
jgi:hypothetical protein